MSIGGRPSKGKRVRVGAKVLLVTKDRLVLELAKGSHLDGLGSLLDEWAANAVGVDVAVREANERARDAELMAEGLRQAARGLKVQVDTLKRELAKRGGLKPQPWRPVKCPTSACPYYLDEHGFLDGFKTCPDCRKAANAKLPLQ